MLPLTPIGRMRARLLGLSGREFVELLRGHGCPGMTLRRLRGIEAGELKANEQERAAISEAMGVRPWELGL